MKQIRGWRATSAAGSKGEGSRKRSVSLTDAGRFRRCEQLVAALGGRASGQKAIAESPLQGSTEVPLSRSALGICPCGDPWGTPLQLEIYHSWAPVKPPRGQPLRSPRPNVYSVLTQPLPVMTTFINTKLE